MKKRHPMPLFRAIEPDVYVIDTSAWLNIEQRSDSTDVWCLIGKLVERGRIVACAAVLSEMRDDPIYLTRILEYETALQAGDRSSDDADYLMHVGKITHQHPGMSGARGAKTKADPYVIALAELEKYVVVADETCTHRPNKKIPGVCKERGIPCMNLDEFIAAASPTA